MALYGAIGGIGNFTLRMRREIGMHTFNELRDRGIKPYQIFLVGVGHICVSVSVGMSCGLVMAHYTRSQELTFATVGFASLISDRVLIMVEGPIFDWIGSRIASKDKGAGNG